MDGIEYNCGLCGERLYTTTSPHGIDMNPHVCRPETKLLLTAVDTLRCIAAMGRKAGSEAAKNWLLTHGYPLEEGGYIPGKGFSGDPEKRS